MPIFRHVTKYRQEFSPEQPAGSFQVFWGGKLGLLAVDPPKAEKP